MGWGFGHQLSWEDISNHLEPYLQQPWDFFDNVILTLPLLSQFFYKSQFLSDPGVPGPIYGSSRL